MENEDKNVSGMPGLYIPGQVAFNPFLTMTEKILFSIIRNLSQTDRGCWATNAVLASYIDCTKERTSMMISKLENYGYLVINRIELKKGIIERRIYESTNYEKLYRPLSREFNNCIVSEEAVDVQQILKEAVINICCPNNPEKFDKLKGFKSNRPLKQNLKPPKHVCKDPLTSGLMGINPSVKHNSNIESSREGNILLEYKYSKKKACKQAHLRSAKTLNRKKQTPVKHTTINSPVQKQQQRLRLDIEFVQQACPEAQKLYEYWNTLGLTRHRDAPTKTKLNSFVQIQKHLKKHTVKEIRSAFDTYAELCKKFPVKFSKQPYKVSLPDFFGWNLQQRQLVSLIDTLKNISGLVDICVLGIDYALDRFAPKSKKIACDNNILSKMSNEASKLFGSVKARRGATDLQRATARLEGFYKDRKKRFDSVSVNGLVPLLFTYVESSNDVGKFKLWWLNSENTFNGFEEWLEENGYLKQLNRFDRHDTVYGKDGRIVRCAL